MSKTPLGSNDVEKAVATVLQYVNYISEDVCGSIGEVKKIKAEIRSIIRTKGLPHMFITINPADTMNPIMQVLAGRDVNLNKIFDDVSRGHEEFERLRASSQNPAAGARAFDTVIKAFVDILLGKERENQMGVFGPLESYYGVVEAQARGSLHCHFFVWLKDGLEPFEIRDKLKANEKWQKQFFSWLESVIKQDLPEDTHLPDLEKKKEPLMSRPQRTDQFSGPESFKKHFQQDLRDLLHVTGQIHEHTFTCFKHLTTGVRDQKKQDEHCRFGLPRETVPQTYIDDDGHIHLVCHDGSVNGYHDIIVYCLRCNMDCKFIGSGTAAYAMTEYVTNYMAKISLDSSVIFSCLCVALAAIKKNDGNVRDGANPSDENARLLLLKICNSMIGKRELSGQQVASFLQGIPNRYTDHTFQTFWWTSLLKFICKEKFSLGEDDEEFVVINDVSVPKSDNKRSIPRLVEDYLYRPVELDRMCLWDFWTEFKTVKTKPQEDPDEDDVEEDNFGKVYQFTEEHPRRHDQEVRRRTRKITPVLSGIQIPRSDKDPEEKEKFQIIAMTLFQPWERSIPVLKSESVSWQEAYENMISELNEDHKTLIRNFQAIHSCKDAADDFSKKRQKMNASLFGPDSKVTGEKDINSQVQDEDWINAMNINPTDECDAEDSYDLMDEYFSSFGNANVTDAVACATSAGFYEVSEMTSAILGDVTEGTARDIFEAQKEYETTLKAEVKEIVDDSFKNNYYALATEDVQCEPTQEIFRVNDERISEQTNANLYPHRQLCIDIIRRLTLNHEQALAFLLFADRYGQRHCVKSLSEDTNKPIRLIISGPGGTGKSQIFQAIKSFLYVIGHNKKIKMTAPTGLAANNINGSTVHSETNLRVSPREMLRNDLKGRNRRQQLEKKYENTKTQVIDEIYFMSARDNAVLSQYLKLANQTQSDEAYGSLNMIFAGDPAQLPPPKQMSLFDRKLVLQAEKILNATSETAMSSLSGVVIWQEIEDCIVLRKIMRQKDVHFQDILNRLRFGNCTENDFEFLQQYIVDNRKRDDNRQMLDISLWLTEPENASPLITYTNAVRDAHNTRCAEAYALYTNQEYHEYHSVDSVNRGKTILSNLAAQAAWGTSVKRAHDLAGKLPLIPNMPIFLTQNIATHLGLSNGGFGKLISAKYEVKDGRRYAISAVVEISQYNGGPEENPHRLTIVPVKTQFTYNLPGKQKIYSASRTQLPIIPAFAFTAHNSQSRTLNRACLDLESCPNTASAYVMLSRLRSLEGVSILRPFSFKKISRHCPQETRNEIARLDRLHENTLERTKAEMKWYYDIIHPKGRPMTT